MSDPGPSWPSCYFFSISFFFTFRFNSLIDKKSKSGKIIFGGWGGGGGGGMVSVVENDASSVGKKVFLIYKYIISYKISSF